VDSRTIALIKESFTPIAGRTLELADRFFNNLFTRQTSVRGFFPADVTEQKRQLPGVIQTILENGDKLENLEPQLREVGREYAQQVTAQIGGQTIATIPLSATSSPVLKYPVTAAQLGTGDMVEIKFIADKTFVPALESSMKSGDPRELGARFFHVFVE